MSAEARPQSTPAYAPIRDQAAIGDGRTVALTALHARTSCSPSSTRGWGRPHRLGAHALYGTPVGGFAALGG